MAIRNSVLVKSVILFSLALAPALSLTAHARPHGGDGPNGGRDSGGGNGGNDPCETRACPLYSDGMEVNSEPVVLQEIRDDDAVEGSEPAPEAR